jgi:hypothetical protein
MLIRMRPGPALSSKPPSSPIRPGWSPFICTPGSRGDRSTCRCVRPQARGISRCTLSRYPLGTRTRVPRRHALSSAQLRAVRLGDATKWDASATLAVGLIGGCVNTGQAALIVQVGSRPACGPPERSTLSMCTTRRPRAPRIIVVTISCLRVDEPAGCGLTVPSVHSLSVPSSVPSWRADTWRRPLPLARSPIGHQRSP